jgi:hypothetical protein
MAKAFSPEVLSFLNIRKKGRSRLTTIVNDEVSISIPEIDKAADNIDGTGTEQIMAKRLE